MPDPLARLTAEGVSVWLDDLSRDLLDTGDLAALVRAGQVTGITSNPTIFAAALAGGDRYAGQLTRLADRGATVETAVAELTTDDVRAACDVLAEVYEATGGVDGRVSLEVDPRLANDTAATVEAARQLWRTVDRRNAMIKIPATPAGLPAITAALAEGISVNATLIFAVDRYHAVMDAHLAGLEAARDAGQDLSGIASVASFFVSRVDTEVDARLTALATPEALALRGTAALANSRLAYRAHERLLDTDRWRVLAAAGAQPQRPLWASTGVKNPDYPDTRYVTGLVAPGTVTTLPRATLRAVLDHAEIAGDTVRAGYAEAERTLAALAATGIDLAEVTTLLEREGVQKFDRSWADLLATVSDELARLSATDSEEEAHQ
jgi:transaldolase